MSQQDTLFVASLEKGLRVLDVFRHHRESLGITEIARATGFNKSAAQRFTNTLHRLGYLERDERTRRYSPAIKLMDLAFTYLHQDRLAEIAMARLIEASKVHGTTVNLCVLDGTDIVYTVRIPHEKASFAAAVPGRRIPAFCTSGGVCILAFRPADEAAKIIDKSDLTQITEHTTTDRAAIMRRISEAHSKGYGIGKGQALPNEISVAAPVLDNAGVAVAAVQIPVYQPHWTMSDAEIKLAPVAMEAARSISGTLYRAP